MKQQAYEQYLSEVENWLHRGRRYLLATCLRTFCAPSKGKDTVHNILEIGAGSGRNVEVLSKFGTVDAVEIEPMAIDVLRQRSDVRRVITDKIPFFLDQKYDVICAMDFLEHVENDKDVFGWIASHLNPGGTLFLTVPAYEFLFSYHDTALGHFRRYTVKQILEINGDKLSLVKKGYFNFFLFPLVAISRLPMPMGLTKNKGEKKQTSAVNPALDRLFFLILKTEATLIKKFPLFPYGLTAFVLFRN